MKFRILSRKTVWDGFFRMAVYQLEHERFAGGWVGPMERELLERDQAVALLLHDPETDQVLLVEQFRPGALGDPEGPWMLEIVAGIVEPGETLEAVARREAREEAGCEVHELRHILDYYPSSGGSSETISIFYATTDLGQATNGGLFGLALEHEDIRVRIVSRQQALQWVYEGRIRASMAIIALQWLALEKGQQG